METAVGLGVDARDVVAIVGKLLAGGESRSLTNDLISFDHEARAIGVNYDPLAAEQGDNPFGVVLNRDKVDKGVGFIGRETCSSMVIVEFVEPGAQAGQFEGRAGHRVKRRGKQRAASTV